MMNINFYRPILPLLKSTQISQSYAVFTSISKSRPIPKYWPYSWIAQKSKIIRSKSIKNLEHEDFKNAIHLNNRR